jgi:hypothetical protein
MAERAWPWLPPPRPTVAAWSHQAVAAPPRPTDLAVAACREPRGSCARTGGTDEEELFFVIFYFAPEYVFIINEPV